ncbi:MULTISPECIES: NUDIX hydrolase [Thermodesulfovibrio]|jgi:8-oxo-dGTP diphosphatase|uniref:AP4A hydrolase n=2 Tax=Thermodesulfovibrio yellowstonii TaxID=28262 RepID=B5YI07_THEYD|nr:MULTISPECIES: NUDIX hydrolase [Thermodesulfovibrio]ACI22052.1 AP4A hydrolase [Thermodesulfovibrio yellowstonii DSM 11347]MBC7190639.1 NUDIX hydrolase [Candidatus Aerophobetes bacterium]MDI6864704.1 NUDIX hydrolase [Thermodesulfovibrio yellowstonii]GLI54410.1 hydrolase [Thermodesulfovibrio islandicus]
MKRAFSAGGIVYKIEDGNVKILLISTKDGKVWALPKGLVEKKEDPKETALREIKEETGVDVKIVDELGEVSYWFIMEGERYFKTVKYFLAEYTGGQVNPDWEVSSAQWFTIQEALKKLTYKSDKEILKKAMEKING